MTASIGIAVANDGDTAETLLRHADAAMYQAKHDGRARATMFRPDHHGSAVAALQDRATTSTARSTATSSCCTTSRSSTCAPDA